MDILIDWDQTREIPFILTWNSKEKKKKRHTTKVTTSITI